MSFQQYFSKPKKVSIGNNELGIIIIDATLSETHKRSAMITENEIEDDGTIVDNYKTKPKELTMSCIISEVPLTIENLATVIPTSFISSRLSGLGSVATQVVGGIIGEKVLEQSYSRQSDNLRKIDEFMDKKARLTVTTGLEVYTNMMIADVTIPKNAKIGDSLQFDISLKEVRIVQSKTVKLPEIKTKGETGHSATSKADLGKQKTEATNAEEQKKGSSILFKLLG